MNDVVMKGFIQKCAELGINHNTMIRYATAPKPVEKPSAIQQGFITKCAELGINPNTMSKYAQIDWTALGEQAKGLGNKALDWSKANPELAGAAGGALAGGVGGAVLGGKGNRMLGGALGAVGGGIAGAAGGHMYGNEATRLQGLETGKQQARAAYENAAKARAVNEEARRREGVNMTFDNRRTNMQIAEATKKLMADQAISQQAETSGVGDILSQSAQNNVIDPISGLTTGMVNKAKAMAQASGQTLSIDNVNEFSADMGIAAKKALIKMLGAQKAQ